MADGVKINVGGVWKSDVTPHINVGGTWKTPDKVHINVGGVWKQVWIDFVAPTCSIVSTSVSHDIDFTCYAQVQYNVNGSEYSNAAGFNNYSISRGVWLDSGDGADAWFSHTRNSGTVWSTNIPLVGSRVDGATTRYMRVRDTNSSSGSVTANVTIYIHDAATGGNQIATATYNLTARYFNACPFCCFTPDTQVTLGSGLEVAIKDVRDGDSIMTSSGEQSVGEVIIRTNVPIHILTFADGKKLELTPDHPLHTERGAASLSQHDYKDIGVPEKLRVGDMVFTSEGYWTKLTHISGPRKEPIAYTFSNSLFYANGLLVY